MSWIQSVLKYRSSSKYSASFPTFCDMPKKSSGSKLGKSKVKVKIEPEKSAVFTDASGHVVIKVHAKPGSKINAITDISSEEVGVQIAAAPVDGEANSELVKYLSKVVGVRKGDISLEKGSKSRTKTLIITTIGLSCEEVIAKLCQEIENK